MESLNEENFGGYDAYFINELLDEHECPVCKMALRKPIQTKCGHRLCLSCAEEMRKRNKGVLICPVDNSNLDSSEIFSDAAIERVIMQLKVKCSNFSSGCEWTGELKILNKHLGSCEYQTFKCLNKPCSTSLLPKNLKEHMEKLCIYRLVTCQYCKQKIIFSEKQIHEENCECFPLCCVNQCGMKIMRKEISSHITDSCANTIIPCQYLNIGCKFKPKFIGFHEAFFCIEWCDKIEEPVWCHAKVPEDPDTITWYPEKIPVSFQRFSEKYEGLTKLLMEELISERDPPQDPQKDPIRMLRILLPIAKMSKVYIIPNDVFRWMVEMQKKYKHF